MTLILLAIIYLIFISLGLPDSFLGASWPAISQSLSINEGLQGVFSLTVSLCTIICSFLTPKLLSKFAEKTIISVSICLTVMGLITIGFAPNFYILLLACIPLGFGAGAIDTILNNYVALHYKAIQLNMLHAFWGIGALLTPLILGNFLKSLDGYKLAAFILAIIQTTILLITLLTLPVRNKAEKIFASREKSDENDNEIKLPFLKTFKLKGIIFALIAFFAYVALEQSTMAWFTSMAVFGSRAMDPKNASYFLSLLYISVAAGRIISGFISLKISDKNLIRIGESVIAIGLILMFISPINDILLPISLGVLGLGCGPIYPAIIHSTPTRFSKKYSQSVMSIQIGFAYIANISAAPLFGIIGKSYTFDFLPFYLLIFFILLIFGNEMVNFKRKNAQNEVIK